MINNSKRLCVIGAGYSGIISCKQAVDCGLEVVVYEKNPDFGGNWNPKYGKGWSSVQFNVSKNICAFSDFMDGYDENNDHGDFPKRDRIYQYFHDYIQKNDLAKHMRMNHIVKKAKLIDGGRRWSVQCYDSKSQVEVTEVFDFLIVATGIFTAPLPKSQIRGLDTMNPKLNIIYAQDYKSSEPFKDHNVLVVGNGNSGVDIVCDLVDVANNVSHNFKETKYYYLSRKISEKHYPFDVILFNREKGGMLGNLSFEQRNHVMHNMYSSICKKQQEVDAIKSTTNHNEPAYIIISDKYVDLVSQGKVSMVNDIGKWAEEHQNDRRPCTVIACNGYSCSFPFFEEDVLEKLEYSEEDSSYQPVILHREMWPNGIPNMAMAGVFRGSFFVTVELQALWAARVFSGKMKHPQQVDPKNFEQGLEEERNLRDAEFKIQFPHEAVVVFTDQIAKELGVLPDFDYLKQHDPTLYHNLWSKPFTSLSYKLFDKELDQKTRDQYLEKFNQFISKYPDAEKIQF